VQNRNCTIKRGIKTSESFSYRSQVGQIVLKYNKKALGKKTKGFR
jgi:hypothetical protein